MKRPNVTLALALVLCAVTATIGFGGDYLAELFRSGKATQAMTATPEAPEPDAADDSKGNPNVRVWVNTNSGVYHCPGTRWYGATKEGEYMTQRQAQRDGYRPAYGRYCE
jgi:hypothetical protein